jgi:hypothetical protein
MKEKEKMVKLTSLLAERMGTIDKAEQESIDKEIELVKNTETEG